MSAYLGNTKVAISPPIQRYLINNDFAIYGAYDNIPWVRPQDWPNLDLLILPEDIDYIFMTYDASYTGSIALTIIGTAIICTIGHMDSNNEYIVDKVLTPTNNKYEEPLTDYTGYPIVRILGTSITSCFCHPVINSNGGTQTKDQQPFVERIAYVPHITTFYNSSMQWGSRYLQREVISNGEGTAVLNLRRAWQNCYALRELNLTNFYTPNVTNLQDTFDHCSVLSELDLRHWSIAKVTTLYHTFYNCFNVRQINLKGWDTTNVTTLDSTFASCCACKRIIGLEDFNVKKVTTLYHTFYECYSLDEIPVDNWETLALTTITATFTSCRNVKQLHLSGWDTSKITSMSCGQLFRGDHNLRILQLFPWPAKVTSLSQMFQGCFNLAYIDMSGLEMEVTYIYHMFYNCFSLKELHFSSNFDVSKITATSNSISAVFYNCYSLRQITGISNWTFTTKSPMTDMFRNCYSLQNLDISGWGVSTITGFATMFYNCQNLKTLDLSRWTVSNNATTFSEMFYGCFNLQYININPANWNTSNVTTMMGMFRFCFSLKTLPDITQWNLNKVTTLQYIFYNCSAVTQLNLPNLNLPACTRIDYMFSVMSSIKSINISNWSIPALTTNLTGFLSGHCLQDIAPGIVIPPLNVTINTASLCYDSLLMLLNALPTVSSTKTLTINDASLLLLSENDIAIATNKGWTLASA